MARCRVISLKRGKAATIPTEKQKPKTSNPQETLATLPGEKIFIYFIYFFPIRIISAKIPEAVTSAPAPAPLTIKGWSL